MDLQSFNLSVESAVRRNDGIALRNLLRLRSLDATRAMEDYVVNGGSLPSPMPDPWGALPEIVEKRFAAGASLNAGDWIACCDHVAQSLSAYLGVLATDSVWSVPLLHAMCSDLRVVAEQADAQLRAENRKPFKLEEAERVLKRGFTVTNNDRRSMEEGSRKAGTLGVINQLLKVYFRLNNLRLCGNLTRTVNAPNFPDFESFPPQDRVTYRFYSGRLHLYDDRIAQATEDLMYALDNIPSSLEDHKRHVLLYLIPTKILAGSLPSEMILIKFNMYWFGDMVKAIKTGNLEIFDDAVEKYEEFFIRKGLYLAVEKMRPLVYRSLCRRVAKMVGNNKVALDKIRVSLQLCGKEMETDEVECIIANLIYKGYIKGYISHKVGYLVLSKKNPFPQILV